MGQVRKKTEQINSAKELIVYQKAYFLAMQIFECSRSWPTEEKYFLTDQIRRSSRSVCINLREAWAKRRYEAHFLSKLTDSDAENSETDTWLVFARDEKVTMKLKGFKIVPRVYQEFCMAYSIKFRNGRVSRFPEKKASLLSAARLRQSLPCPV